MTSPRCLLMDLGKVILDLDYRPMGIRLRALTGLEEERVRQAFLSDGLAHAYESGAIDNAAFHAEICRRFGCWISYEDFAGAWTSIFKEMTILPESLIATLAAERDLWALSNTNKLHFEYVLKHFPVLRHFRGYIVSYEVGAAKPDPRIYMAALNRAGIEPGAALFVDDLAANVDAARDLGIDAFQFVGPEHFVTEMRLRNILH